MGPKLDIGTGSATLILDTVSAGPWYETIHGLNILINIGFLGTDNNAQTPLMRCAFTFPAGKGAASTSLCKDQNAATR